MSSPEGGNPDTRPHQRVRRVLRWSAWCLLVPTAAGLLYATLRAEWQLLNGPFGHKVLLVAVLGGWLLVRQLARAGELSPGLTRVARSWVPPSMLLVALADCLAWPHGLITHLF
ncbi:hypothetical protein F7Q99_36740 [Streptomyces kaniharaensis]|uniref:Uncharacterized protein n=1 Tax=Streptomyces kaniharaensis TaxID=212423 RepID=A0A6N7L427_9ACTN|nr:hypothetical protein [Streptomyces kaniharaensis]MQS17589.1 hypothetical protein [Streptomyces kaniharaensis]